MRSWLVALGQTGPEDGLISTTPRDLIPFPNVFVIKRPKGHLIPALSTSGVEGRLTRIKVNPTKSNLFFMSAGFDSFRFGVRENNLRYFSGFRADQRSGCGASLCAPACRPYSGAKT
jgi:hypothetical protein